jgi:hypothetical protein
MPVPFLPDTESHDRVLQELRGIKSELLAAFHDLVKDVRQTMERSVAVPPPSSASVRALREALKKKSEEDRKKAEEDDF